MDNIGIILITASSPQEQLAGLDTPLLEWYYKNARSMPWRDDPRPYWVWLSEIMLQQTRVEAARGYFHRFVDAIPDIPALAGAGEETLLKLWEGLGYYSRVRNLQKAAVLLCRDFGGALPASYQALRELPGVGEYTAGAIASIAFGIPVPAVDGNVYRVVSRLLSSTADTSQPAVKRAYRELVAALVPLRRPGDFNQALMELGATVCLPNGLPRCLECPLCHRCQGHRLGTAPDLPVKAVKKARRMENRTILLVVAEDKVLLHRRDSTGLLGGMWEPLNLEGHLSAGEVETLLSERSAGLLTVTPLPKAKHIFSHVEWHMAGFRVCCDPFPAREGEIWADEEALTSRHPLPSAFRAYKESIFTGKEGN